MEFFRPLLSWSAAHEDETFCIAYSPDSSTIATGSTDHTIQLWDTTTGSHRRTITGHTARINALAFSPGGHSIATASGDFESSRPDNTVRIWNLIDGAEYRRMSFHEEEVYAVVWSPDGKLVASGSKDSTIHLWNVQEDTKHSLLSGHRAVVYSVAFSPDGHLIASCGADKSIIVWDVSSGRQKFRPLVGHTHWVSSIIFNATGTILISGSWDSTIRVWSTTDGSEQQSLGRHSGRINCLALSPDGRLVASASGDPSSCDNSIRVWALESGQQIVEPLVQHTCPVYAVAFAPDGCTLASAGKDGSVFVWDAFRSDARLAVAMALHPRLGAASPLAALEAEVVATILHFTLPGY